MRNSMILCVLLLLSLTGIQSFGQPLAFFRAEGGGKYTSGGRGGKVLFVENLNDNGKGSLRIAVETKGPRTVIFRVSGIIALKSPIFIKNYSMTIAGQTAPGDGICLKNYGILVEADNLIIRYIRIRPGNESKQELDAISGINHKNIIIDHCSFSWSNDETASFYNNRNFTMQWCIISESLSASSHHKGEHGFGGIWGGDNATFHHNLLSDHTSRNPRFCGSRYTNKPAEEKTDFRNNVIYNWGYNSAYGGEEGNYNMVNNYYKPGPATDKKCTKRILDLTQSFFDPRYNTDTLGAGKFFIKGNVMDDYPEVTKNNWQYGIQGNGVTENSKAKSKLRKPVSHTKLKTQSASDAYQDVLNFAGANLHRDAVDIRIIEETRSGIEKFGETFHGGKKGIIDSPEEVGGWPVLKSGTPPTDADNDGMADDWEISKGLDPHNQSDGNRYTLTKNFTNLEVYLNSSVEDKLQSEKTKR